MFHSSKMALAVVALLFAPALAEQACGETIYIDYLIDNDSNPDGNGGPSSFFGAALGIPGQWNELDFFETSAALFDWTGGATGVTVSNSAGAQVADHPSTSGDDEKLLDDGLDGSTPWAITVSGLAPGLYQVYTYAWHPAGAGDQVRTSISVNGSVAQIVGRTGPFAGYLQGETHALHLLSIAMGEDLVIDVADGGGPITGTVVNGLQIHQLEEVEAVPEPATLSLLGVGVAAILARRRVRASTAKSVQPR